MKNRVDSISKPATQRDYTWKQQYEEKLDGISRKLLQEMGRVTPVTPSDEQQMVELVEKVAKLWLEVGQQRCRILLSMSNSGAKPRRSEERAFDTYGQMPIVVVPALRRRGTVQGARLDTEEVVMDCSGTFSVFVK